MYLGRDFDTCAGVSGSPCQGVGQSIVGYARPADFCQVKCHAVADVQVALQGLGV